MFYKILVDQRIPFEVLTGYGEYVDLIRKKQFFSFTKLNYSAWDHLCGQPHCVPWLGSAKLMAKVEPMLKEWPANSTLFLGVGFGGHDENLKLGRSQRISEKIRSLLPSNVLLHDALVWKKHLSNNPDLFINAIRSYHVVVVGLSHLQSLGKNWGLPSFERQGLPLHYESSEELIQSLLSRYEEGKTLYLFQGGEAFSLYLIRRMYDLAPHCFMLDMGKSIDYFVDRKISPEEVAAFKKFSKRFYSTFLTQEWMKPGNLRQTHFML